MLLTFCRHRIERQMVNVRKGWVKLKATSMHSDRLSDAMLAACMSAATQLKSLIAVVMSAVSKGEMLTEVITCPFENCVSQLWFCLQLEMPVITSTTVAAMEIYVTSASSAPCTPIPPSTPPPVQPNHDGDDPAAAAALGSLALAARAAADEAAAALPDEAPATAPATPEPEPPDMARCPLHTSECVDAFASLMRSNMTLYSQRHNSEVYPGDILSGTYPEGFDADPVAGYDARETVKRSFDEAFGRYANRWDYLEENGFKAGSHGDRMVQPPQPGMSPVQLCVASEHRQQLIALTSLEMKAWDELARAASDNSKLCASLLDDTHSSQADHVLEIVRGSS